MVQHGAPGAELRINESTGKALNLPVRVGTSPKGTLAYIPKASDDQSRLIVKIILVFILIVVIVIVVVIVVEFFVYVFIIEIFVVEVVELFVVLVFEIVEFLVFVLVVQIVVVEVLIVQVVVLFVFFVIVLFVFVLLIFFVRRRDEPPWIENRAEDARRKPQWEPRIPRSAARKQAQGHRACVDPLIKGTNSEQVRDVLANTCPRFEPSPAVARLLHPFLIQQAPVYVVNFP